MCSKIKTTVVNIRKNEYDIYRCFCAPKFCHGNIIADYLNIEPKVKPYVDALFREGFVPFSSCDGGEGHVFKHRTIRIHPTVLTMDGLCGFPVESHGNSEVFKRFELLLNFIEKMVWTYCTPKIVWPYDIIRLQPIKKVPRPFFELIWN